MLRLNSQFPYARRNENKRILNKIKKIRELDSSRSMNNMQTNTAQSHLADPTHLLKSENEFKIKIVHVKDFGHFYAHLDERSFTGSLQDIEQRLNDPRKKFYRVQAQDLFPGKMVCCPRFDPETSDYRQYRARVVELNPKWIKVFFVDYGYIEEMDFEFIWALDDELAKVPFHV